MTRVVIHPVQTFLDTGHTLKAVWLLQTMCWCVSYDEIQHDKYTMATVSVENHFILQDFLHHLLTDATINEHPQTKYNLPC